MPTETLYATSLTAGAVSSSGNALGAPNGTWTTDTGNTNWTARFAMGNPVGNPATGTHTISIQTRKEPGQSGTPVLSAINLYSGTFLLGQINGNSYNITSTTGTPISATFDASTLLSGISLASIEVEVVTVGAGGSPSVRASVQIDSITWTGNFDATVSHSGSVGLSGSGTITSTGFVPEAHSGSLALSGSGTISASGEVGPSGPGQVTIGNVQTATSDAGAGAVAKPTGLANGDVLYAFCGTSALGATAPSGFTVLGRAQTTATQEVTVARKVVTDAGAEPATYTWGGTSGRTSLSVAAFLGVDQTTQEDVAVTTATGSGSVNLSTTTASANALVVAAAIGNWSTDGMTVPPSMTQLFNLGNPGRRTAGATLTQASAGATGTLTFVGSGTLSTAGLIFAVKAAPGGGGPGGDTGSASLSGNGTLTLSGSPGEAPAETVTNLWVGGVTTDSASVGCRVTGGGNATLVVSTSSDLSNPITGGPVAISSGLAKPSVTGLAAGTQYHYGISIDGELDTVRTGTFRTAPSAATNFSFVFGSCATTGSDPDSFTRALARDPDLCFINGDLHYEDPGSATEFHTGIDTQLGDSFGALAANVPTAYTWSDHDWSSDNNGGASSGMNSTANSIYRSRVPHWPLGSGTATGIYQTFTWGRVRFIVTDERSFKSSNSATDDSSKTMLGATQKQWFKDTITNSAEEVIFWVGDTPWNGAASTPDDEWFAYNTERQELATFFQSSGKNIIRCSGDMHALAADDGTNSPGGIPILHAAPWNNAFSNKGGPYTSGPYPTTGSNIRQYGHVTVTDDGSDITVTYAGYDTSDIQRTSWTDTYTTTPAAPEPPAMPTGNLPADGISSSGWTQVVAEDFTTDCAEGQFLTSYPGWFAYPDDWTNSPATSTYNGGNSISVTGGIATIRYFHDGTTARSEALEPPNTDAMVYGVYEVCYRVPTAMPGYKQAFLLWPESDVWGDGEIDYPESGFTDTSTIGGFVHEQGATPQNNAYTFDTGKPTVNNEWHVARIVWGNDRLDFYLDGVLEGTYTSSAHVPDNPHRWVLQTEGTSTGPAPSVEGTMEIAYVTAWEMSLQGSDGTIALSGDGGLTATGGMGVEREIDLTGSGTLTATGTTTVSDDVDLSGTGSVTLSGSGIAASGSLSLSGSGTVSTTGGATHSGTLALSGDGTQARTGGTLTASGTLGAAGEGTQTRAGSFTITGSMTLGGGGALSGGGTPSVATDLDLSGAGSLDLDGTTESIGTLALSGDGQIAASGTIEVTGDADLSGAGSLDTSTTLATTGELTTSGSGSLFLGGDGAASGSLDLSGAGQVTASGSSTAAGSLELLGNGVLSSAGEGSEQHTGSVDLTGGGQITAEGSPSTSETLNLTGDGSLSTTAHPSTGSGVPLSGSGSVAAAGSPTARGSVATAGAGVLLPGGSGASGGTLNLSGAGQVASSGAGAATSGALDLSGGSIVIFGSNVAGSVALSGAGEMLPVATRVTSVGAIDLAGAGEGLWEGAPRFTATVALSGAGQVALAGSISAVAVLNLTGDGILRVKDVLVATDGLIDLTGDGSLDGYAGEPPFYPDLQAVILAPVVRAALLTDSVTATIELDTAKAVVVTQTEVTQ